MPVAATSTTHPSVSWIPGDTAAECDAALSLPLRVQRLEVALSKSRALCRSLRDERDRLKRKVRDARCVQLECSVVLREGGQNARGFEEEATVVRGAARLAGRVRLRRSSAETTHTVQANNSQPDAAEKANNRSSYVSGAELSSIGVCATAVAEEFTRDMRVQADCNESAATALDEARAVDEPCKLELERARAATGRAAADAAVWEAALGESRAVSERLATAAARLEANQTALRLAAALADAADRAADALLHLSAAAPHDDDDDDDALLRRCSAVLDGHGQLFINCGAESASASCLASLEWSTSDEGFGSAAGGGWTAAAARPSRGELAAELRARLTQLRDERRRLLATQTDTGGVDWWASSLAASSVATPFGQPSAKLDLETAVLLQEVAALKESVADLKAELYLTERDRESVELALRMKCVQLHASQLLIGHLTGDASSEAAELSETLETLGAAADERWRRTDALLRDLRAANAALVGALDRLRRRHRLRLGALRQHMDVTRQRLEAQVSLLRKEMERMRPAEE